MNLEILKLIQGLLKPDILSNFTLNKEIEELNSHISTLKMNNINVDPFLAKLENLCYQKQFGFNKEKYDFFHSQKSIKNHFSDYQLKKMSLYTYKIGDDFRVVMGMGDKIFNSILSIISMLFFSFTPIYMLFNKSKENLFTLSHNNPLFLMIVVSVIFFVVVTNFAVPLFHVRKFNKLYPTN